MKFLITAGATREFIDQIRFITNHSTGETASLIAETLLKKGHQVTFVHGLSSQTPAGGAHNIKYSSFDDLDQKLQNILANSDFDYVIHAAAVSDFSVESVQVGGQSYQPKELAKIDSSNSVQINLKRNFKILERLKIYSKNPNIKIIAFKLTHSDDLVTQQSAIRSLFKNLGVELVVHNDFGQIAKSGDHEFAIYDKKFNAIACEDKLSLAEKILNGVDV